MRRRAFLTLAVVAATLAAGAARQAPSIRLYVLDGGVLDSDPARYRLKNDEVTDTRLSIAAFLVVHPRGTLMWDAGAIADDSWMPTGKPVDRRFVLSNGAPRHVAITTPLKAQLAEIGHNAANTTFFALSHYHWDHVANANDFAGATWLVPQSERDAMFPAKPHEPPQPSTYAGLLQSKAVMLTAADHDVFGDGTVVIKRAAGHTPGHQVLYVKLARTGGVVLAGDLYHYPEERTLNRLPTTEFNEEQTRLARESLEAFLGQSGAQLWIQHDLAAHARLKKAPAYYD